MRNSPLAYGKVRVLNKIKILLLELIFYFFKLSNLTYKLVLSHLKFLKTLVSKQVLIIYAFTTRDFYNFITYGIPVNRV